MILRVFRSRVRKGREAELASVVRERGIVESLAIPGLVSLRPGVRTADDGRLDFILASTWIDIESVLATGRDLNSPLAMPAVAELLEPGHGDHYEIVVGGSHAVPVVGTHLRVVRGQVKPNAESTFYALSRVITSRLLDTEGVITLEVGRRMAADTDEAIIVSLWQDDALEGGSGAAGDDLGQLFDGEFTVEHFDALTMHDSFGTAPAMMLLDDERRYVYATPAAARILGRSVGRLLTMRVEDLLPEAQRDDVPRLFDRFIEQGEVRGLFEYQRPDGRKVIGHYAARAKSPWRQTHLSLFVDNGPDALDFDAALEAAGLPHAV